MQPRTGCSKECPMTRFEGSTALQLDFGHGSTRLDLAFGHSSTRFNTAADVTTTAVAGRGPGGLRLARPGGALRGPDKYKVLEHRRRQAQIKARHLLELMEEAR